MMPVRTDRRPLGDAASLPRSGRASAEDSRDRDAEATAQQLMRALRGKRSQQALARRLAYRGNPITDWEHGRRYPTAHEMLRAAESCGINVRAALERFARGAPLQKVGRQHALHDWMRQLLGDTSLTEFATKLGRSRSAVSRWLSGTTKPRLPEFLEFIDVATGRLHDLVAELVEIDQVPAVAERHRIAQAARLVAFEEPWSEAILRVLETDAYHRLPRHDNAWLGCQLELPADLVAQCLYRLEQARVVRFDGQRFTDLQPLNVDTRGGRGALHAVKAHWGQVAAGRALEPRTSDVFAYNVCSCSRADMDRIRDILHAAYREIRALVAGSQACESAAVINLNLVGWMDET